MKSMTYTVLQSYMYKLVKNIFVWPLISDVRIYTHTAVTNLGSLGDWYTGLDAQTLAPKKHFSSFLF